MQTRRIEILRTARYHVLGDGPVDELWMTCHGYGEQAGSFLARLAPVVAERTLILAPEALSRFYIDDRHQRVGASWMTREERRAEIGDYVRWLDTAYADALRHAATPSPARLITLGFSQGCATIARWVATSAALPPRRCDQLILWGGLLPPDLDLPGHRHWLTGRLTIVAGDQDRWLSADRLQAHLEQLDAHQIDVRVERHAGGHRLDADLLMRLAGKACP